MSLEGDRKLYFAANKLLGVLITLGEALAYVLSGMYGDVRDLGALTAVLLVAQLTTSGFIVLMLDDLLSKGYGLGSGLNLFIVTNICEGFIWKCISPTTFNVGKGTEFEGALIAGLHGLLFKSNKLRALQDALFRENLPNLTNVLATVLVFLVVIYIQGFKVDVPLRAAGGANLPRGYPAQKHSIKLFYTSNMPIILLSALVANVYFFSQVLHRRYPANILVKLLGKWSEAGVGGYTSSKPIGGLSYYISPPGSFEEVIFDPFHALFYFVFMLSACALFAKTWIEISGAGPGDVTKQLKEAKLEVKPGNSFDLYKMIPTAAAFGGMCVAALSVMADLLGAIGSGASPRAAARCRRCAAEALPAAAAAAAAAALSTRARHSPPLCYPLAGTGILMAVTIIYDLWEKFQKEIEAEIKANPDAAWVQALRVKAKAA